MEIKPMLQDLARAKSDLVELSFDDRVTQDRLARCEAAAMDLETAVCEIISVAWIPRDPTQITRFHPVRTQKCRARVVGCRRRPRCGVVGR